MGRWHTGKGRWHACKIKALASLTSFIFDCGASSNSAFFSSTTTRLLG